MVNSDTEPYSFQLEQSGAQHVASVSTEVESRRIQSYVRIRPLTRAEAQAGRDTCILAGDDGRSLRIATGARGASDVSGGFPTCTFDGVFLPDANINTICQKVLVPATRDVLRGYRNAVILYGQTGGGKTFTLHQLAPTFAKMLFTIGEREVEAYELSISIEVIEIYLERIADLLDPQRQDLQVREFPDTGVYVKGASESIVTSASEFERLWSRAMRTRQSGATALNDVSSRSHCITCFHIRRRRRVTRDHFSQSSIISISLQQERMRGKIEAESRFGCEPLFGC
jgi:hypothetical protein